MHYNKLIKISTYLALIINATTNNVFGMSQNLSEQLSPGSFSAVACMIAQKNFKIRMIKRKYYILWQQENITFSLKFHEVCKQLVELKKTIQSEQGLQRDDSIAGDKTLKRLVLLITKHDAAAEFARKATEALKYPCRTYAEINKAHEEFKLICTNRDKYLQPFLENNALKVDKSIDLRIDSRYETNSK